MFLDIQKQAMQHVGWNSMRMLRLMALMLQVMLAIWLPSEKAVLLDNSKPALRPHSRFVASKLYFCMPSI